MRVRALTRWQKASALVPMAVLVGAWGVALANSDLATASDDTPVTAAPQVPTTAFDEPASILRLPGQSSDTIPALASNDIPAAALAAYRRGESLLAEADAGCHLPWHLLAAIGRVESDHGRAGGNTLDAQGISRPGVFGPTLDGRDGLAEIADTDGGVIDQDPVYDRAVGPMQFIPSTWRLVRVDADGDGVKNPQSISDAATAAGIYLCAGESDLSTDEGTEEALLRYNHSSAYGAVVMEVSAAYAAGELPQSPAGSPESNVLAGGSNDHTSARSERESSRGEQNTPVAPGATGGSGGTSSGSPAPGGSGSNDGTGGSTPGSDNGGSSNGGNNPGKPSDGSSGGGGSTPPKSGGGVSDLVGGIVDPITGGSSSGPVTNTLTWTEAKVRCLADGISALDVLGLTRCITSLLG